MDFEHSMLVYPTAEEIINGHGNLSIKRSLISLLSLITLFCASTGIIIICNFFVTNNSFLNINGIEPYYLYSVPLVIAFEILRRKYNDIYILSKNRLTHFRGRLSLSYNVPVIRVEDIRAINVVQDFWGRIFNFGDVIIGTSAHIGPEIVVTGIRNPEGLALLIDELRRRSVAL
jgi:hypothetical protein